MLRAVDGLTVFVRTFKQLNGWSGEPCLPANTAWQWLGCTGSYPPRVTSMFVYLSIRTFCRAILMGNSIATDDLKFFKTSAEICQDII